MKAKQVTRAGVMVALLVVSAWVMVPFGPVPFTLQTLVLAMLPALFDGPTTFVAVGAYVLMGALGLPVFSGCMGGVGVLAGPTGGFLWGFVLGVGIASAVKRLFERAGASQIACVLIANAARLAASYTCGTIQLMAVGSMGFVPAAMAAVVPFVIPDVIKVAIGTRIGLSAARALNRSSKQLRWPHA